MPRKTPGKKTPGKGRGRKGPSGLDSDMEDDVDVFHKQRDRIGLDSVSPFTAIRARQGPVDSFIRRLSPKT